MADDDGNTSSLGGLWKNFRENSSAHGIPRTSTATSMVRRVMWSLLFLGACAYFIFQFHGLMVKYFSYPVVTNVEILFEPEVTFPAVAVCNLNAVRRSKLNLSRSESEDVVAPDTRPWDHCYGSGYDRHCNRNQGFAEYCTRADYTAVEHYDGDCSDNTQ
ncbi:PREDICTED: degenerin-like protein asic-2 [Branchiostoma belcheri]|uniref:Degenerin-like protein asic-2 n=1 Tax=Branchiostoma belcheri TaxID=7741 RepID=A0A6P5A268_BRABE|nr:PREDICTED: degenerin-like protein asic-2 [Branchiostoma belcheri]